MTQRLFVAIDLDHATRAALARTLEHVSARPTPAGVRLVGAANLHITLQFLGDVEPHRQAGVLEHCQRAAATCAPFALSLGEAATFGPARKARLVFLALADGAAETAMLARSVSEALGELGLSPDERDFHPHITLARCRRPHDLRPLVRAFNERLPPRSHRMVVQKLCLFRSHLGPEGARYERLADCPLSATAQT